VRIRQVKPEFWKDRAMADLSPVARLTYVGLWMLADDAGYLRLDTPEIGLELYGWDDRAVREEVVGEAIEHLIEAGRVVRLDCGQHGRIPTLTDHQRFAGETKRVYTVKREHDSCPRMPAGGVEKPAGDTHLPDTVSNGRGKVRNVSVRKGSSNARERDEEMTEFQRRVPRPVIQ
jgi:hypothetical protein